MLTLFLSAAVLVLAAVILVKLSGLSGGKDEKARFDGMDAQLGSLREKLDGITLKLEQLSKEQTVISTRLDELKQSSVMLYQTVDSRLGEIREDNEKRLESMRQTLDVKLQTVDARLGEIREDNEKRLESMRQTLDVKLQTVEARFGEIRGDNEKRLEGMRQTLDVKLQTVDARLREIREDNGKQLEQMRQTVDEKLEKTLENRLTTTFKTVSDQLESVYKQLGEMQNLAKGVGNLERVLTNVKARGVWGELQAERILQEILTPEQYLKNVSTKKGSRETVEFAVRLPGTSEDSPVLMPIDSKFPREDYERLCDAAESGDGVLAKSLRASLERRIRDEARDIRDKYIDVPNTTDFAVMFLPVEGLYAEVLAVPGLQERLQHEFHVMVAGPATLASLLNSLQMGFRTLAIEKKSAEVWQVLGQVKTEFSKFETTLGRVQEKLSSASREVEQAFTRQRVMARKLKNVEASEVPVIPFDTENVSDAGVIEAE